jgi:hypothetical protein
MKKMIYIFTAVIILASCKKLDIAPVNMLSDKDIFTSPGGVQSYMAALYIQMPIEDFKYNASTGYNQFSFIDNINAYSGENMNKNVGSEVSGANGYYGDGYKVIRNATYFIETMPKYASLSTPARVNSWLGEAYFIRAFTYFELAKRYGGVPIIKTVQNYPGETLDELQVARSSEQEVYDYIADDLDMAYSLLGATSENRGRANKYAAAAFKSRAMLFAGSIAKYNIRNTTDPATSKRVQGIASTEAVRYFKASYAAALLVEAGGYSLYRASVGSPAAKATNYYNLFFDLSSANKEAIFTREYSLNNSNHSYQIFANPLQQQGPQGYSSYICPTEDYVELFDGLNKNPDGSLKVTDASGKYILYPTRYGPFQNAEPRLLGTVIVPGATFRGQEIDVLRGIYTGSITNGIAQSQFSLTSFNPYANNANVVANNSNTGTPLVNNVMVNGVLTNGVRSGGLSGVFGSRNGGTISGYHVRKYSDEKLAVSDLIPQRSVNAWYEIRYAEVLLNRAEADFELYTAGQADANYLQDAFNTINDIRDRAGANLLISPANLTSINIIRNERRKELAFENKLFWDIKRWRTADLEINQRYWMVLNPFLVAANGQYFFDRRQYEGNQRFTFNPAWYYDQIPSAEITKNPKLYQNQTN